MKRFLLLLAISLFTLGLPAETYTIVFNSGNADSSSKTSELANIVLGATNNCAEKILLANNIYRAKAGFGIKGGTTSAGGELTIGLDATYTISNLTIYTACFGTDSTKTYGINVCGQNIKWQTGHKTVILPYTITLNQALDNITIAAENAKNNRWYVQKIEFEAEDPHPNTALFEMPYIVDCGSANVADGEIAEDVVNINVLGKHIDGQISVSLKNGNVFSLGQNNLPSTGGEVDIAYSLSTKGNYIDSLWVSATGLDGILVTKKIPLKITGYEYTPPTFDVDSSCMAIGPMPGNYYLAAQGAQDSVLKSRLGEIIFCGVRYKYGSGNNKTWAGFYYTDRDTVTNQVLDMYSNNIRYFNSDAPTASVAGFDIEHMLPKSWWGGTVNEAYCDLFHLVPGDLSANRSKSNHAPGIPTDSTFWNGSFATGNGETYGLSKVFCPADEYKGDFARAYFYIATCYGDTLTWEESGEPGMAMTNKSWQEFQPWLRDLLVDWHRADPVSEKEKNRAIEVNKIQGNRNPFIDYPDLVEFIWGNKQGEEVDFHLLEQSFGDEFDETARIVPIATPKPAARKEIREGQLLILRNASIYTILGQRVK